MEKVAVDPNELPEKLVVVSQRHRTVVVQVEHPEGDLVFFSLSSMVHLVLVNEILVKAETFSLRVFLDHMKHSFGDKTVSDQPQHLPEATQVHLLCALVAVLLELANVVLQTLQSELEVTAGLILPVLRVHVEAPRLDTVAVT